MNDPSNDNNDLSRRAALGLTLAASVAGLTAVAAPAQAAELGDEPECIADLRVGE